MTDPIPAARRVDRLARRAVLAGLHFYQLALSPLIGGSCRFTPSCSQYATDAVSLHGVVRGGWLAARRLARCHPFGSWGVDPVPPAERPSADDGAIARPAK